MPGKKVWMVYEEAEDDYGNALKDGTWLFSTEAKAKDFLEYKKSIGIDVSMSDLELDEEKIPADRIYRVVIGVSGNLIEMEPVKSRYEDRFSYDRFNRNENKYVNDKVVFFIQTLSEETALNIAAARYERITSIMPTWTGLWQPVDEVLTNKVCKR